MDVLTRGMKEKSDENATTSAPQKIKENFLYSKKFYLFVFFYPRILLKSCASQNKFFTTHIIKTNAFIIGIKFAYRQTAKNYTRFHKNKF